MLISYCTDRKLTLLSAKPKDVNAFLSPFVEELNEILQNGLTIEEYTVAINIRCFICDTPARSMLRGYYYPAALIFEI